MAGSEVLFLPALSHPRYIQRYKSVGPISAFQYRQYTSSALVPPLVKCSPRWLPAMTWDFPGPLSSAGDAQDRLWARGTCSYPSPEEEASFKTRSFRIYTTTSMLPSGRCSAGGMNQISRWQIAEMTSAAVIDDFDLRTWTRRARRSPSRQTTQDTKWVTPQIIREDESY